MMPRAAGLVVLAFACVPMVQASTLTAQDPVLHASTGDAIMTMTTFSNEGTEATQPVVVAMNIVNLDSGSVVDPEDWSPERTQYVESVGPGETIIMEWTLYTILAGHYAVYFVAIEQPPDAESPGPVAASHAIQLVVADAPQYNPGGILPFTVGVPVVVAGSWLAARAGRKRKLTRLQREETKGGPTA